MVVEYHQMAMVEFKKWKKVLSSFFFLDINECKVNNPCVNGKCINTAKGFKCECKKNYQLRDDGITCIDIDECLEDACGPGICSNIEGGFNCVCDNGYYNGPNMKCIGKNLGQVYCYMYNTELV